MKIKFRVFDKKVGLYTDDTMYPSNQRSYNKFAIAEDGELLEMIHFEASGNNPFVHTAPDNFIVEFNNEN